MHFLARRKPRNFAPTTLDFPDGFPLSPRLCPQKGGKERMGPGWSEMPPKNQASVSVLRALFLAPAPFWVFSGRGKKATIYWQLGGQWGVGWGFHSRSFFPFAATSATDSTKLSRSLPLFAALASKTERGREEEQKASFERRQNKSRRRRNRKFFSSSSPSTPTRKWL